MVLFFFGRGRSWSSDFVRGPEVGVTVATIATCATCATCATIATIALPNELFGTVSFEFYLAIELDFWVFESLLGFDFVSFFYLKKKLKKRRRRRFF